MAARLILTRSQILAHRRRATALDARLPHSPDALRRAAWAGLQDSMPRAALLSIHARVADSTPAGWEDPSLVQIWGPRFSVYVVARCDLAVFTLGRLPLDAGPRHRAQAMAARLQTALAGARMPFGEAARVMGEQDANRLRYAAPTGTVVLRWDGARQPEVWSVPAPDIDPREAQLELARRYLHAAGPATPEAFAAWAGVPAVRGSAAFAALGGSLVPVRTPHGDAWILAGDVPSFDAPPAPPAPVRLVPSGDIWFLLHGADRELLVPDARQRRALWPSRVWPGALLVDGEIAGTWRRAEHVLTVLPWHRLDARQCAAIEAEAWTLPLPGISRPLEVRWRDDDRAE
jgi:hypothetical protein